MQSCYAVERHERGGAWRRRGPPATVPSEAPERIVVAGGDGSIAPAAAAASRAGVPLAVVPVGTANDFASAHGPSGRSRGRHPELAAPRDQDSRSSSSRGWRDRPFVNAASAGLAPAAARKRARAQGRARGLPPTRWAPCAPPSARSPDQLPCRVRRRRPALRRRGLAGDRGQLRASSAAALRWRPILRTAMPRPGRAGGGIPRLPLALRAVRAAPRHARAPGRRDLAPVGTAVWTLRCRRGHRFNVDGEIVESGPTRFTVKPRAEWS